MGAPVEEFVEEVAEELVEDISGEAVEGVTEEGTEGTAEEIAEVTVPLVACGGGRGSGHGVVHGTSGSPITVPSP